ncbi:hypothetical protein DQ04_01231140 [Trypanosoma grayi]|uniref:hypothetical protein n=1 Tax=Trypanosoma grayi TaxID=71804 RepID=UPI0004F40A98|nr:hypothetical protein DQ04_01231140 [Trypanosoma grayi]KEG13079.1 hypothetical protein DQ04_01231140 [Trypanosoma grayi]
MCCANARCRCQIHTHTQTQTQRVNRGTAQRRPLAGGATDSLVFPPFLSLSLRRGTRTPGLTAESSWRGVLIGVGPTSDKNDSSPIDVVFFTVLMYLSVTTALGTPLPPPYRFTASLAARLDETRRWRAHARCFALNIAPRECIVVCPYWG